MAGKITQDIAEDLKTKLEKYGYTIFFDHGKNSRKIESHFYEQKEVKNYSNATLLSEIDIMIVKDGNILRFNRG